MPKIGLAVGRNTHAVVELRDDSKVETRYVANGGVDAMTLAHTLGERDIGDITVAGNRRWVDLFCRRLEEFGIMTYYVPRKEERGSRGKKGNFAEFVKRALETGARRYRFFPDSLRVAPMPASPEDNPWVRAAHEYVGAANDVREAKHAILDCMVKLFPEAVRGKTPTKKVQKDTIELPVPEPSPPELFTKKMRVVLENPDPRILEKDASVPQEVRILARFSLGRATPADERANESANLIGALAKYDAAQERKSERLEYLRAELNGRPDLHAAIEEFGGGDLIVVTLALIGWRRWHNYREVRRYCGLDPSRLDANGDLRLSRVRPFTRQYLYLLGIMTKRGKEVWGTFEKGTTHTRVKGIVRVLKHLLNHHLRAERASAV